MSDQAIVLGLGYQSLALPPARMYMLERARLCPGSRVVMSRDGRVIEESLSADMVESCELSASEAKGPVVEMEGAIALYQTPRYEPFPGIVLTDTETVPAFAECDRRPRKPPARPHSPRMPCQSPCPTVRTPAAGRLRRVQVNSNTR